MEIKSRTQLVGLMKELGLPLIACECGVAEGSFSLELLQLGIQKLYMIDLWENVPFISGCASFEQSWHDKNYNEVLERTKNYKDKIVLLKGFSYKMSDEIPDNSLGLVYLDAAHDYNSVKSDLLSFYPKLIYGGIMSGHDFGNESYEVDKAVREFTKGEGINVLEENGDINNMGFYFIKK